MPIENNSVAIYRQIIGHFEMEIASGRIEAGGRIDSIRALALQFKVNPNTVQKALNELERKGLIETDRTNGKYVTDDAEHVNALRSELARKIAFGFSEQAKRLGMTKEEMISWVKEIWEKEHE